MKFTLTAAALMLAASAGFALAEDAKFTLDNQSDYQIDEFYASPANDDQWGEDILGQDVLEGGSSGTVTIADGSDQCVYDLKAVDEDGNEHVLEDLDICARPNVIFNK
ncbi:MAG: hypothetical protein WCC66_04975 [Rhizobiaceae bacterium]